MLKSPPGYSIVQENRPACKGKGGGLAFIIKNTVNYSILNTTNDDKHLEVQGIKVTLGETNINIINTYIPPSSSCDSNYTASISNLLKLEDSIIVGDFTMHINHSGIRNYKQTPEATLLLTKLMTLTK